MDIIDRIANIIGGDTGVNGEHIAKARRIMALYQGAFDEIRKWNAEEAERCPLAVIEELEDYLRDM